MARSVSVNAFPLLQITHIGTVPYQIDPYIPHGAIFDAEEAN